ncbi:MAG: hypothetical protein HOV81_20555 [Kofleriaceae bacterium]|nr:hypothetical protein [Kofleriaceae bacterium]
MRTTTIALVLLLSACAADQASPPETPGDDGDDMGSGSGDDAVDPCATPVILPTSGRALDLMPPARLAELAARVPCIAPGRVRDVIESPHTFWYDKHSLTPGYQDSFGDNVITPIGMRPNTIDHGLIDTAVPGGHAQIFVEPGTFHFPFGRPAGDIANLEVVDFWQLPESNGTVLPVVHWRRDPNEYTHRVEWMFPAGTVFGELMFMTEDGQRYPFEIRTRTRTVDGWVNDIYRPFPRATDLADAIEARRTQRPEWATSPALDALVSQLRDGDLTPYHVAATHFAGAFPALDAGIDALPTLTGSDAELVHELLMTTPFRSMLGLTWKETGGKIAYAAAAAGTGSIVPKGFNAAAVRVDDSTCATCHRDAGRPFETWYDNILAYGELWGNDEIFTWHPFRLDRFVDDSGAVVNFNHDNREIRADFISAGLVAPYSATTHPATIYKRIVREWTDFAY